MEAREEVRWGDDKSVTVLAPGTGIFGSDVANLIYAKLPARTWNIDLAYSLPNISALPTLPNFDVTVTFIILLGLGSSRITRYVQLFTTDLVAFALDPTHPFRLTVPIASTTLQNVPAKEIWVSAHVEYQRILLAGPDNIAVLLSAAVAPVFR